MPKFEAPRGTQDILPAQQPLWDRVLSEAESLCSAYGYRRVTTPIFEDTELFARTSGAGSDVVQKEMYTFTDRGDRSLTLRPEATASVARAYIEHGLHREPQPVKVYSIGPNYRYSAPQRGKFREFWQLNIEALGSDDPAIDAEIIQLFNELLRRLGIEGAWLELNSIGDRNCRPAYLERLNSWLDEHASELDEDTLAKRTTSPLRVFDNLTQKPEAVQRAEVHRRLVEAVFALAEPYRTTILLRYFEDLPPREVARRMEAPVETVRTRVSRGLEILRRRLEGAGGREWLGGLALLAGLGPEGTAASGAGAVDICDPTPTLDHDAPTSFGVGTSTEVRISAADARVSPSRARNASTMISVPAGSEFRFQPRRSRADGAPPSTRQR